MVRNTTQFTLIIITCVLILTSHVSADYIELNGLISTNIDSMWVQTDPVQIEAVAPGMGGGSSYFSFEPGTQFSLTTSGYVLDSGKYLYTGSMSVASATMTYFSAGFDDLQIFGAGHGNWMAFGITSFFDVIGPDGNFINPLEMKVANGFLFDPRFSGQISGDGLKQPVLDNQIPEPATILLFCLGLLGITGITRKV